MKRFIAPRETGAIAWRLRRLPPCLSTSIPLCKYAPFGSPIQKAGPAGNLPRRGRHFSKRACKPNSVVCGHSSRRRVAADTHQRPTRRFRQLLEPPERIGQMRNAAWLFGGRFPPYLVLLRVGFTLPPALQPERCALTAPFHPYPCGTGRPGEPGPVRWPSSRFR